MTTPTVLVDPFELQSGPGQARKTFTGIAELAKSIRDHGLLHRPQVRKVAGKWVITAGERRVRAIRKLSGEGHWSGLLECDIDTSEEDIESNWKGIVENVQREDVPIWQLGRHYAELISKGIERDAIAAQIGKPAGGVSKAIRIAEGLHPVIIAQLEARLPDKVATTLLLRMASMLNLDTLEPDLDRQRKALNLYLNRTEVTKGRTKRSHQNEIVLHRFNRLKDGYIRVPAEAQPYLDAIVNFLGGFTKGLQWP
jgi:ParB/RepB/Spo0J family partition protein